MYFSFFKLKKWGKKTAETRRRNCAVLPLLYYYISPKMESPFCVLSPLSVHLTSSKETFAGFFKIGLESRQKVGYNILE